MRLSATNHLRGAIRHDKPVQAVRAALQAGANPNAHMELLPEPAPRSRLQALLSRLPHSQPEDPESATLLVMAIHDISVAELLLKNGADPNLGCKFGSVSTTPLCEAAAYPLEGAMESMRLLLDHGANPNLETSEGTTPLMRAAGSGFADTVKKLLDHGADARLHDASGETALHYIAMGDYEFNKWQDEKRRTHRVSIGPIVRLLLQHGAEVDAQDHEGKTTLTLAAACETTDLVKLLLRHHANPNHYDRSGYPPLSYAPDGEITTLLRKAGGKWPDEPAVGKIAK